MDDDTSTTTENKKYRLGNQSKEYEIKTDFLGWMPERYTNWSDWNWENLFKKKDDKTRKNLILVAPDGDQKVELIPDHVVIKDAFPLDFYGEERARGWDTFLIVSKPEKPDTQFLIPLH